MFAGMYIHCQDEDKMILKPGNQPGTHIFKITDDVSIFLTDDQLATMRESIMCDGRPDYVRAIFHQGEARISAAAKYQEV